MNRSGTFRRAPLVMGLCALLGMGTVGPASAQPGKPCDDGKIAGGLALPGCDIDVTRLTLTDIRAGYTRRLFTAEQLVRAYLEHIARYEAAYNAFTFVNPHALEQARDIDARRRAGRPLGPLAGVPVVIKESMDVGFPRRQAGGH
jgi:amidase